jgi:DNA-binding transcriptional LysR family regulator
VSLTPDGAEALLHFRHLYDQYEDIVDKYCVNHDIRKKFGVSTLHYSFAVKAFVELAESLDTAKYDFAIRESRTLDVIEDVRKKRSEIGILYLNDFNRVFIKKLLRQKELEFHHLKSCRAYVYLWKKHPLADRTKINFDDLKGYPCLSFEQGDESSFYMAEEVLSTEDYDRVIKACDRATMLNLMKGLNGYTLCSGIICEELNGDDFVAVPFEDARIQTDSSMEIGYITGKHISLSSIGQMYIDEIRKYLDDIEEQGSEDTTEPLKKIV